MKKLKVLEIVNVSVKKTVITTIRIEGDLPSFMNASFKKVLQDNGYSSTLHFSKHTEGQFDIITSTLLGAKMLAPHMFEAA